MRWKAHYYLSDVTNENAKHSFCKQVNARLSVRNCKTDMVKSQLDNYQKKIKHTKNRQQSIHICRKNNRHMHKRSTKNLITNNITQLCKKTPGSTRNDINQDVKNIATKMKIDQKINRIIEQQACITAKDHKPNILPQKKKTK